MTPAAVPPSSTVPGIPPPEARIVPQDPSSTTAVPHRDTVTLRFEVTSKVKGVKVHVTVFNGGNTSENDTVETVPWSREVTLAADQVFLPTLAAYSDYGRDLRQDEITCALYVDGRLVDQQTGTSVTCRRGH